MKISLDEKSVDLRFSEIFDREQSAGIEAELISLGEVIRGSHNLDERPFGMSSEEKGHHLQNA
jgi:hypothetical protein